MGTAIAESMAGTYDVFGRLPVTFYKNTQQLPDFADYNMQGRTYRYMTDKPLYPFGYGLNYGKYHVASAAYDAKKNSIVGTIVTDRESPARYKSRLVQLYLMGDDPKGPRKTLIGLAHDHEGRFSIDIDPFWLRQYNENTGEMEPPKPGTPLHLLVGLNSDDKEAIKITIKSE